MPSIYKPKKPQRDQLATMMRCFLVQALHSEIDRELGIAIWSYLEKLHPISSMADWVADLNSTGYIYDEEMTKVAHEKLGPVFRVMRAATQPGLPPDPAGYWRWLQDTRDIGEFYRMGQGDANALAYIEVMRRKQPNLRAELLRYIKPKDPARGLTQRELLDVMAEAERLRQTGEVVEQTPPAPLIEPDAMPSPEPEPLPPPPEPGEKAAKLRRQAQRMAWAAETLAKKFGRSSGL